MSAIYRHYVVRLTSFSSLFNVIFDSNGGRFAGSGIRVRCRPRRKRLMKDTGKQGDRRLTKAIDEGDLDGLLEILTPVMTQFELAMIVAKHAQEQWGLRCAAAAGLKGYSHMDLLVLHMVGYGSKRLADICFALNVEDTHVVSYALKKLQRAKLVSSQKIGKDTFFAPTPQGNKFVSDYRTLRKRYLIKTIAKMSGSRPELEQLTDMLRMLSGLYQQAARSAENSAAT